MKMDGYKSLLLFIVGLIATSVALVAAAFSAMKDAWPIDAWRLSLLSFMGWMAVTILLATVYAAVIQSLIAAGKLKIDDAPSGPAYFFLAFPILSGCIAAAHLVQFALNNAAPIFQQ